MINKKDARLIDIEKTILKHEKRISLLEEESGINPQDRFIQGIYITFKVLTTVISLTAGIASIVKLVLYIF